MDLSLVPYSPRAIRVRYSLHPILPPSASKSGSSSLIVTARPDPLACFTVNETAEGLIFSTPEVTITIQCQTLAFTYCDSQGHVLMKEPARGGKTLNPVDVLVSVFDEFTAVESRENADGVRSDARNVLQVVDRQAYHTKLEFEWSDGEALYGLGSHEEGMFNLRGQHQYLYQQNMKAVVPVLVSTRGYGIFLDSCSLMTFHDDAFGSYLWSDVDDELDYYFIYGPEFDQIVHEIRALTGHSPMLPNWAFGYIQSKERYVTQDELLSVVCEYRHREIPLDCIVLDWKSWTGDLWGEKILDPERFPDPDQMTADLHALNARLMVSIWPIMRPGGENWQEMKDRGTCWATRPLTTPSARRHAPVTGNRPTRGCSRMGSMPGGAIAPSPSKPTGKERSSLSQKNACASIPGRPNVTSILNTSMPIRCSHSQGIYEGQRQETGEKRVVNLTRSAYLGQQRYATVTWSGDTAARWDTLRRQIADGLNFCVTGMPYWTTDIGGFFVKSKPELWFWSGDYDDGVDDLGYRELFVRWFQYGAFLPMFRAHGTDTPREIWHFGEPANRSMRPW